jgi:alpha-beta hydrolase superfamily lysophospholipase
LLCSQFGFHRRRRWNRFATPRSTVTASLLAYRVYPAANNDARNIVIVIHGSAGHSTTMNEVAKRLAADNLLVVSPDMRGHGGSPPNDRWCATQRSPVIP